jgi:hypothetical protein
MKLIMENWRRFLHETSNREFLERFVKIYNEWQDLQATYGPIHQGQKYDPDGEPYPYPEHQSIPIEAQPAYVKDDPKYYGAHVDHPATRRATFSQTQQEVDIEKEVLRLFQEFADQSFFRNDVIKYHDLGYAAAIQKPWVSNMTFSEFARENYLGMEGQRGKDVMSCHGSTSGNIRGGFGMILQGHTVFASRGDLGSQTLRVAHQKVREKHAGSGLPKRASPHKIHPTEKSTTRALERNKRLRDRDVRMGRDPRPEITRDEAIADANTVVLNAADVTSSGMIEELLLDNWTIEGWYFRAPFSGLPHPEGFWRKAYEMGITKPVYEVDIHGGKREASLEHYFGSESTTRWDDHSE